MKSTYRKQARAKRELEHAFYSSAEYVESEWPVSEPIFDDDVNEDEREAA